MEEMYIRTASVIGIPAVKKLMASRVIIFGVGGVGGFAAEALCRAGVGSLTLVDADTVAPSNINRQIIATEKTLGMAKVDAFRERIRDINPRCEVVAIQDFFLPEKASDYDFKKYDMIIDAVDTVSAKIALAEIAERDGIKIISSMGAGNKMNPTEFEVADIYRTSVCPLARIMRSELKKRGVKKLKVVYSKEKPLPRHPTALDLPFGDGRAPGSLSFVPSVAGLIIASEAVKDLISDVKD